MLNTPQCTGQFRTMLLPLGPRWPFALEGCPLHCSAFSSILHITPVVTTKDVSRLCQKTPGEAGSPLGWEPKGGWGIGTRKRRQVLSPAWVTFTAVQFGFFQLEQSHRRRFLGKGLSSCLPTQSFTEFNFRYVLVGTETCKLDVPSLHLILNRRKWRSTPNWRDPTVKH